MTQQRPPGGALPRSNTDPFAGCSCTISTTVATATASETCEERVEEGRRAVELLPRLACPEKGTCLRAQLSTAHGNSTPSTIITPTHTRTQWFDTQLKKEEGRLVTVGRRTPRWLERCTDARSQICHRFNSVCEMEYEPMHCKYHQAQC